MTISADLGNLEMLLETNMDLCNIDLVFNTIVSNKKYSNRGVLVIIESNTMYLGAFSKLDTRVRETIFDIGSCVSARNKEFMVEMFRKKKKTLSILLLTESVHIFTNDIIVSLLQFVITRDLTNGTLIKRRIDLDILMCLLAVNSIQDVDEDETYPRLTSFRTTVENESVSMQWRSRDELPNVSAIRPRYLHSTTAITDSVAFPKDSTDLEIIAFPNDSHKYNHNIYPPSPEPKQSSKDEKYPTQVTETDAGQLSIESYSRPNSSIYTERTDNRRHFVQQRANGLLVTKFSQEKPMPLNQSMVTSGTGTPYHANNFRYPDYVEQQQRLASFQTSKWAIDNKPDPFLLAEWGFFFTGTHDLVRCHQCGIGLKDWIKDDDVLTEHVKHSSSCDFLRSKLGTDRIDRMKMVLSQGSNSEVDSIRNNVSQLLYKIRSPRYQTMEARVTSFKNFPQHIKIPIQELAVAGLFFTGNGDLCRCFTCDGGLKDWSTGDDPVKEHATYFRKCAYIKQLKGEGYIQQQQRRATTASGEQNGAASGYSTDTQPSQTLPNIPMERMPITNSEYSSYHVSQVVQMLGYAESEVKKAKAELERKGKLFPTTEELVNTLLDMQEQMENLQANALPQRSENDVQELVEENKKLSQLVYCMLCVTGEADILFLPCTHHRLCHECASDVDYCPVCNRFIKEKVKTFRS